MLNSNQKLALAVLEEAAEKLDITRRAHAYRGAADFVKDAANKARLIGMAEILEEADHRCREFRFNFIGGKS